MTRAILRRTRGATLSTAVALVLLSRPDGRVAFAQPTVPPAASDTTGATAPKGSADDVLGTVDVTGSSAAAPQKIAIIPVVTEGNADSLLQLVVRRDLELSGQFDVVPESTAPTGPFLRTSAVDARAWRDKGIDLLVRVIATAKPATKPTAKPTAKKADDKDPNGIALSADVWLLGTGRKDPSFTQTIGVPAVDVRFGAHRLTDAILEAITGRAGGFASKLAYTARVGKGQQVFVCDADGFDLHGYGPSADTAISPAFGPKGEIYYALSVDHSPFRLVHGPSATAFPLSVSGSILGVTFSPDRAQIALAVMKDGTSSVVVGNADGTALKAFAAPGTLANHPVFGPLGKMAWVAGSPPRIVVDGKPVSPAGYSASAPTFCDSPRGLLVVYTVGVGKDADLVASDTSGGGLVRLTQGQGANSYPACSPDGRLVASFSTRKTGAGAGLYLMPILAPGRAHRISADLGTSLRWEATAAVKPPP